MCQNNGDVILRVCRCVVKFMVHRLFMESPSKNSNDGLVRALGLNVVLYFFVLYTGNLRLYVTRMDIIGVLVVATVLIVALFKRWRTLFVLVLLGIIMVSGAFVNPISRGVSAVYGKN